MIEPTLATATDRLHRVAVAVTEASEPEAVARFLERLAEQDDAPELRDALVVAGAAAVLRQARPGIPPARRGG